MERFAQLARCAGRPVAQPRAGDRLWKSPHVWPVLGDSWHFEWGASIGREVLERAVPQFVAESMLPSPSRPVRTTRFEVSSSVRDLADFSDFVDILVRLRAGAEDMFEFRSLAAWLMWQLKYDGRLTYHTSEYASDEVLAKLLGGGAYNLGLDASPDAVMIADRVNVSILMALSLRSWSVRNFDVFVPHSLGSHRAFSTFSTRTRLHLQGQVEREALWRPLRSVMVGETLDRSFIDQAAASVEGKLDCAFLDYVGLTEGDIDMWLNRCNRVVVSLSQPATMAFLMRADVAIRYRVTVLQGEHHSAPTSDVFLTVSA